MIEQEIKDYITKNLLFSDDGFPYSDDASFLQESIVDSVGIMELVAFVEDTYKIPIKDEEIVPENFDSVTSLSAYVRRKSGPAA
jgi:acyl carrier protein